MAQCVILAGGKGTRMSHLTRQTPKALIDVNGRPFLHYQLEQMSQHGFSHVVLSIGYLGQMIRDFAQDGQKWGLKISYVDEGTNLRGTGGALKLAQEQGVLEESFGVLYGDSYLPISFANVWLAYQSCGLPLLMTVFRNSHSFDKSNVLFDGSIVRLYDKRASEDLAKEMKYIDYGFSILTRKAVEERIPSQVSFDISDLYKQLSTESKVAGYEVQQRFFEIGSVQGLSDLKEYLAAKNAQENLAAF